MDLITQKAVYFDGSNGEKIREEAIPEALANEAAQAREHMLESLAMYSDELMELLLGEEEVPVDLVYKVTKEAVHRQLLTPVFMGTAYRNKGIQPLLDAIVRYLPSPLGVGKLRL